MAQGRTPMDRATLKQLRENPVEWRRRGLTPPSVIEAMVAERLGSPVDPSYADFFSA